jgi:hypothetical protein
MEGYVEDQDALFGDVFKHLSQVHHDPASKLDEDLLKRGERSLDARTSQVLLWRVLQTGETLLQTVQQDPRPLTRLLERTVRLIPFDDLRTSITSEKLQEGLKSPAVPVKLLCLAYLTKAADSPSGVAFIASDSILTQLLISTWLADESTEVSERAIECISALLTVDSPASVTAVTEAGGIGKAHGQGLLWRKIFHDPDVYSLLFAWTSFSNSKYDLSSKKGQRAITISQARLFDLIVLISPLNWAAITTSTLPIVEQEYQKAETQTRGQPYGGILRYAASDMIDPSDYMMEVLRRDFFMKLLGVVEENGSHTVPPRIFRAIQEDAGVDTLQNDTNGLHL